MNFLFEKSFIENNNFHHLFNNFDCHPVPGPMLGGADTEVNMTCSQDVPSLVKGKK